MQKGNFKMGKLSKAKKLTQTEKYCIQGMFYNEMELSSIAKSLDRDEDLVLEYVKQLEEEASDPLIINETYSGKKGVAVMTQEGSERVDNIRQEIVDSPPPNPHRNAIHDIK